MLRSQTACQISLTYASVHFQAFCLLACTDCTTTRVSRADGLVIAVEYLSGIREFSAKVTSLVMSAIVITTEQWWLFNLYWGGGDRKIPPPLAIFTSTIALKHKIKLITFTSSGTPWNNEECSHCFPSRVFSRYTYLEKNYWGKNTYIYKYI